MTRRMAPAAAAIILAAMGASGAAADVLSDPKKEGAARHAFVMTDPGGSKATGEFRRQVADAVYEKERATRPNCIPELMSIRVTGETGIGSWMERWFVRSCFERFPYRVTYMPGKDPGQPVQFKVIPEIGKHGSPVN